MDSNKLRDGNTVLVQGNLEFSMRILKKKLEAYGLFKKLKDRANNPSKGDRRRLKAKRSAARIKKIKGEQKCLN